MLHHRGAGRLASGGVEPLWPRRGRARHPPSCAAVPAGCCGSSAGRPPRGDRHPPCAARPRRPRTRPPPLARSPFSARTSARSIRNRAADTPATSGRARSISRTAPSPSPVIRTSPSEPRASPARPASPAPSAAATADRRCTSAASCSPRAQRSSPRARSRTAPTSGCPARPRPRRRCAPPRWPGRPAPPRPPTAPPRGRAASNRCRTRPAALRPYQNRVPGPLVGSRREGDHDDPARIHGRSRYARSAAPGVGGRTGGWGWPGRWCGSGRWRGTGRWGRSGRHRGSDVRGMPHPAVRHGARQMPDRPVVVGVVNTGIVLQGGSRTRGRGAPPAGGAGGRRSPSTPISTASSTAPTPTAPSSRAASCRSRGPCGWRRCACSTPTSVTTPRSPPRSGCSRVVASR